MTATITSRQGQCCDLKKKTEVRIDVQIFGN